LQHFHPKILFFVFDFCAIFAAIWKKQISLRGICSRNQTWEICTTHSLKRGVDAGFGLKIFTVFKLLFSQNFMSFYRSQKKKIWPAVSALPPEKCFFRSQSRL
jgi:hypothetical protein